MSCFLFVCTSQFNQDCIGNFASLRARQGWNENRTAAQFQAEFRSLVELSSLDSCTSSKNCVNDDDFALLNPAENSVANVDCVPCDSCTNDQSFENNAVWSKISQEILNADICY